MGVSYWGEGFSRAGHPTTMRWMSFGFLGARFKSLGLGYMVEGFRFMALSQVSQGNGARRVWVGLV